MYGICMLLYETIAVSLPLNSLVFSIGTTMSSMPKAATPGLLSVANLLASIQHNSSMAPAATAREELQATQLLSENDMNMAPTPLKMEKEGDLGTLGFPGGGG
jgi:hypothetical protein